VIEDGGGRNTGERDPGVGGDSDADDERRSVVEQSPGPSSFPDGSEYAKDLPKARRGGWIMQLLMKGSPSKVRADDIETQRQFDPSRWDGTWNSRLFRTHRAGTLAPPRLLDRLTSS